MTLSDDCDDVSNGRRGDSLDSTTDDVFAGNTVLFSHMRSLKCCTILRLCAGLSGTTSSSLQTQHQAQLPPVTDRMHNTSRHLEILTFPTRRTS